MNHMNALLLVLLGCVLFWAVLIWLAPTIAGWLFIGGLIAIVLLSALPQRIRKP
jgi:hypothetical protein